MSCEMGARSGPSAKLTGQGERFVTTADQLNCRGNLGAAAAMTPELGLDALSKLTAGN